MKKARTFLILGIWIAVLPYLGFPLVFKNVLFTLSGLVLMYLSYLIYKKEKTTTNTATPANFDNFLENKEFTQEKPQVKI